MSVWLTWAGAVIGLWTVLHWPLCSLADVWPAGLAAALARESAVSGSPLTHLLVPLAVGACGLAAGLALVRALDPPGMGDAERLGFGASFGLGLAGTALAWLALAGGLTPRGIAGTLAALGAAGVVGLRAGRAAGPRALLAATARRARAVAARDGAAGWIALGLAACTLLASLLKSLVPPWNPDALYYQLTLPRLYLEAGGFAPQPHMPITAGYPGLSQMLFATALAAGHDDVAAVFSWLHLPLLALATALLARGSALVAVVALLAVPQLPWTACVPLVDVATAAHLTFALCAARRAWEPGGERWRLLAALSAGFALANKYLAAPAVALLLGALALRAVRLEGAARGLRAALVLALVAGAPFVPWGLRNQREWGSPLFPFHLPAGVDAGAARLVRYGQAGFASLSQAASLPWLPFDLTFMSRRDDLNAYQGEVGPLPLALLLLPLALAGPRRRARVLGAYALALFLVWAAFSRQVRFLFPLLPPLFAACLAGRPRDPALPRVLLGVVTLAAGLALAEFVGRARPGYDLLYLAGRESRASYYRTLHSTSALWEACEALRGEPADARVLFFWEYRGYLCPRPFLLEHPDVLLDLPRAPGPALARIRAAGATHVLVNRSLWEENAAESWPFGPTLEALLAGPHARRVPVRPPIAGGQRIELYRLVP